MAILTAYSIGDLLLIFTGAFIIGLSKAGLKGIDMLNVTVMALVFGSRASTGIVLPLLCVADIGAVLYYHRHAQWNHFWKLIPWMAAGILIGVYTGKDMNEPIFRKVMAIIIITTVIIMAYTEFRKSVKVPANIFFISATGLVAGFTTMLGNLAGAFSNIYFLAMRIPKNDFIGTAAWIFLVINFFKLPFQVFFWRNINTTSLLTDLILLPAMALGFMTGLRLVNHLKDHHFRRAVIILTLAGAFLIFLKK